MSSCVAILSIGVAGCSPNRSKVISEVCPTFLTLNRDTPWNPDAYTSALQKAGISESKAKATTQSYFDVMIASDPATFDAWPVCEAAIRGDTGFLAKTKSINLDASVKKREKERQQEMDDAAQNVNDALHNLDDSLSRFQRGY